MSRIKISADTSPIKKSLLDLSNEVKKLGKTENKISIISEQERRFFKKEIGEELKLMKRRFNDNRKEVSKLVDEAKKLERGSQEELKTRGKINRAYRTQAQLSKEIDRLQASKKQFGGFGGMGGGMRVGGMKGMMGAGLGMLGGAMAGGALALGGYGVMRGVQSSNQYRSGVADRVRLRGLGVDDDTNLSPERMARAGLTEQELIARRSEGISRLGRDGAGEDSIVGQATFERAYGLEEGAMMNSATALRAGFGGQGANEAQMKLQASVFATGMEDAIGPYLESATSLLAQINENGLTSTDEMINLLGQLTKDGTRTPEQLAKAFQNIDQSVKGSQGEANAFLQTAFARGGIGGGTIGSTRLAIESGGIFGLNEEELQKRGYNEELIGGMRESGFMAGTGERTGAILDQFKMSAGLSPDQNINEVSDMNTMVGLSSMANSVLGTQGIQGFDALKMLEDVQSKKMTQEDFDAKLQEMREDNEDPSLKRLTNINESLAGQTDVLMKINENVAENVGQNLQAIHNAITAGDTAVLQGLDNITGIMDGWDGALSGIKTIAEYTVGGKTGEKVYDWLFGAPGEIKKEGNLPMTKSGMPTKTSSISEDATQDEKFVKNIEKGFTRAMSAQKTQQNATPANKTFKVTNIVNGKPTTEKTYK